MSDLQSLNDITEIRGIVERITYRNEQNGYTVAVIRSGREQITVVGILPFVSEGETLDLKGKFVVNPTYGTQFSVESFERTVPETAAAILRYLSSGIIKGVGPGTATRIVEKFGTDSLDIIQNHPEDLALIKGISMDKAMLISKEYSKQFGVRDIMLLLSPYDVTVEKCVKVFKVLGSDANEKIKQNPYVLCFDGINFSFELVEKIAHDFKISPDCNERIEAGILYILNANLLNGHTCLPKNKLLSVAQQLLDCDESKANSVCDAMVFSFKLISNTVDGCVFVSLPVYYNAEKYISARLNATAENIGVLSIIDDLEIEYVENKLGIKFESLQRQAIRQAFESGILVLTGGPGTGKTTTLNAIIELLEMRDLNIYLAAPTGRAAQRMTELTGRDAMTIHRLLEVEWSDDDKAYFSKNEKNPLECDVIIIDEASMIDTLLFESLLKALRLDCRIILVGDIDQLPSVGAGNVLSDILSADRFPSIRLNKVFRQAMESKIIKNAHAIINGEEIDFSNNGTDFFMINRSNSNDVCNTVLELCTERLVKTYGFDPLKDIQILCPSRKMNTGTVNFNNILQSFLNPKNPKKPQISYKGVYMREGDKVMQTRNNYGISWVKDNGEEGIGIFNGDVGYITSIDLRAGNVKVRFDDKTATYETETVGELELAYAITVHKSQGSEFECVVLPLYDIPSQLRYRNLLYTAITRAKKILVIVGDRGIAVQMAQNDRKTLRYTLLRGFLDDIR